MDAADPVVCVVDDVGGAGEGPVGRLGRDSEGAVCKLISSDY